MTSMPAAPLWKLAVTGMHAVRRQCAWRGFARRTRRRVWRCQRITDVQGQIIGSLPCHLRGEGSTAWLHSFAARTGRDFFSVDFAPEGYENARRVCGPCAHRGLGEFRWLLAGACDVSAHSCYAVPCDVESHANWRPTDVTGWYAYTHTHTHTYTHTHTHTHTHAHTHTHTHIHIYNVYICIRMHALMYVYGNGVYAVCNATASRNSTTAVCGCVCVCVSCACLVCAQGKTF